MAAAVPGLTQDRDSEVGAGKAAADSASPWTEADSRLANHYIQLLQKDPSYGKVLDLLWGLYEKKGQIALLLDYFKGASADGPAIAKLLYAHLLRKNEEIEEARTFYDEVLSAEPTNLPALRALAEIADQQKRGAKALSLYTRLVELVPVTSEEGVAIRLRKAALHRLQGQTELAVADWKKLLETAPGNVNLRAEIVGLLLEAGETASAVSLLTELAQSGDPRQKLDALLELSRLHEFTGDFEPSVETAKEAMGLLHFKSPEYVGLFSRLVRLHERNDRLKEMEDSLRAAAASENPTEQSLEDLVRYYHLVADPMKEEEAVEALAHRLPADPSHRIRLAELELQNDRYEAAAATLDELMSSGGGVSLDLHLRRALVDLQSRGREAAESRLTNLLDEGHIDADGRKGILEFARTHYLDKLVERLLRDPVIAAAASSDENAAPIELARFLHERGRSAQAISTLQDYVDDAAPGTLAKASRLHQIGVVYKELGLDEEALAALDEAITLAPENLEYQSSRADLYISTKAVEKAIAQLEAIREKLPALQDRAEVDQRLFSLIRGHYATRAELEVSDSSVLKQGRIQTLAEYRRLAAAATQSTSRSGDEPPPKELIAYYEEIKRQANESPATANRYRAAWWAFKLQDNQECFHQLNLANDEAGKPVVEVEKMLLNLAEQNERTTLMVRHLSTLIEIDPANASDYRRRRAEMRFELGFEDEAVRELKELATEPDAPLSTLGSLAKLYQRQGSSGKQVEVWQRAFREADLFEKRNIVKQLSNALIESGRAEEALKAQLELLEKENDPLQRRKQLDAQLTVAQTHFLLPWMRERYSELAARHPFDRFYPEALARVHRAAGEDREAFEAMKKAYYMSGQSDELLDELGELSDRLGDLKSAIYYRRQLLARGEGDDLENWKELVRMLEKDLRISEADDLRRRLESKFGSDPDFLAELAGHYLRTGSPRDAERTLRRLVSLRGWDLKARFRLGLLQARRGEQEEAFATFNALLKETGEVSYPERFGEHLLPLIRVDTDFGAAGQASGSALERWVFTVEAYPFTGGNFQDELAEALQQDRPEFKPEPDEPHLLRLRAIEEASSLAAELGRVPSWLAQWNTSERPFFERLWATRHSGARAPFLELLRQIPEPSTHLDRLGLAYCHLLAGEGNNFLEWVKAPDPDADSRYPRSLYAGIAAQLLIKDNRDDRLYREESVLRSLAGLDLPKTVAAHHFSELRKTERFAEAYRVGEEFAEGSMADEASFQFALAQVAGFAGLFLERETWLDRSLALMTRDAGSRVSGQFYAALTEKLALLHSDTERAAFVRQLDAGSALAPMGEREVLERRLHFFLALGDTPSVIGGLKELVALQGRSSRPASSDAAEAGHDQNRTWQQLDRTLHHYAERTRLDATTAPAFVEAFGGEYLLNPADASAAAQFEQFEIDRNLLLLEWMSVPEREAFLRQLRGFFKEPDSRIELAKALENRGFQREAVEVYREDAIRRDRDYAPLQGLFDAANEALDPGPALEVITQINNREFPAPPGLTVDYLNDQHARFLLMDRDLERLEQLSRAPTGREGAPPVNARSHLPYQDALVEGYRRTGNDDALLRLLDNLRKNGGASVSQLLLGAETLAAKGRHTEALDWITPVALDPVEPVLQRRAIHIALAAHASLGWKDPEALRGLALSSMERQPSTVTREIAASLHAAGLSGEASGVLRLLRRKTTNPAQRTAISIELLALERRVGKSWEHLGSDLEAFFLDFVYEYEERTPRDGENPTSQAWPGLLKPNAFRFVEWIVADPEPAAALQQLDAVAPTRASRWLRDLLAAHFRGDLNRAAALAFADLPPGSSEAAQLLETLPAFGDSGLAAARKQVGNSGLPGDRFFPNEPERQIAFFHRIGDRPRLIEVHTALIREAASDFFHQSGLEDWVPCLDRRGRVPLLFEAAGETDLARRLFETYDHTVVSYQWNHLGFLNDHIAFLLHAGDFESAESILKRVLSKSLRIDLRLLPRLYAAWNKEGEWETRTRDLLLTRGQEVQIRDWMSALAEGRELRETRETW
ncbi:MAG: hypothetical protein KDN18_05585 [Verrucomicrobiae bacterium]|nr:hypothetical protein [Verrucomicrobiae bacterium]